MITKLHIDLPVFALLYDREEVIEWQEDRDYANDNRPKDISGNRFHLGYTAFFEGSDGLKMDFEPSKAVLPEVYDWLMDHAPNARIEVGEYDLGYDSEIFADDEDWDPEDYDDDDEEASSGAAEVYLNFGDDHTRAVFFKLRFA
ncbi:hypothetical protein JKG68_07625 [Microvirga aerilata]|uniref:Uncharacterized protein n=1 Tax=Microvirga aerilata TaxID=670292 RepID=A0A937CWK9_9HYPH|nr:hypothetical protein [Microvirga aerilata]MBL0403828.1 hypothetical protein [Microvirga aerilata]